ncbi:MAG TPA: hypothetical protein VG099_22060 [Gemmataceae bacterium]|jgi:hypothetical protein|nr:hypothetical protein [Gemmataceae bacterium]
MKTFLLSLVAGALVLGGLAFTPGTAQAGHRGVRRPVVIRPVVVRPAVYPGYYYYWHYWVRR